MSRLISFWASLQGGMTYEEVMQEYAIEKEDILSVLDYASKHLADEELRATA